MSLIFPEDTTPSEEDRLILERDIRVWPAATFQILNKILNERGLQLTISVIGEAI